VGDICKKSNVSNFEYDGGETLEKTANSFPTHSIKSTELEI